MKVAIGILFAVTGAVMTDLAGECDLVAYYSELGCTPDQKAGNSSGCPDAFVCPDLHPDPTMCFYRGVAYGDGTYIPQNAIKNPCSRACICRVAGEPRFDCAAVDCVEVFENDSDLREQCISTYNDVESCCATGSVCGKDAIAALKTCEVDGKTYREGESFEPKDTHKTCVCTEQWNGKTDNPEYCRDVNCGLEIHYQSKILNKCAPVFYGNRKSCPIDYECPSSSTQIVRGVNVRGMSQKCVFGNDTLAVGDELLVPEKCTKCQCQVPPFISCVRKNTCDN